MDSKLKLLVLDHQSHSDERHDHPEGLFVARGEINLVVDGTAIAIKKGGKTMITGRIEVAADGKSRTVTAARTDPNGKNVKSTSVYNKQ